MPVKRLHLHLHQYIAALIFILAGQKVNSWSSNNTPQTYWPGTSGWPFSPAGKPTHGTACRNWLRRILACTASFLKMSRPLHSRTARQLRAES